MKIETHTDNYRNKKSLSKVYNTDQVRRAKMRVSDIDSKKTLTPALRSLLEASLILETTSTKILSAYLKRSPSTIRAEYQQILMLLGGNAK
ncbi:MAG: hypothetical protein H0V39_05985 [Nitrosomonas sp.]|jgi:hypothetical protein|nr:hypothetical protein [Nitrosomonas sp.]